ncbi:aminopeptidase PaaP [Fodinibacter luteus]|uniref:Aminopeptidase PaaP n=1 Tax=Fodinibacter luteus TaxID=552064 RepID=A0ABP8K146_9MICO
MGGTFVVVALLVAGAVPAAADSNNNNSAKLRRAVTVAGIVEHQQAFQAIADAEAGNRLSGSPGYDGSADYVAERAAAAGFDVEVREFDYALGFLADYEAPVLRIEGGTEFIGGIAGASLGGDFGSMFKSTPYSVDVTAPVWAIDLALPATGPPNTSTSGCQDADYAGMPPGAIIIVQRGTCTFADKFLRADAAGAAAMVFINEGQPGRTEPLWFNFDGINIPTFAATVETGTALANGVLSGETGVTARFKIDWRPGNYTTSNVIAETTGGDPDNVIVVGAHLDSVGVGAGINDNGSGSATILEIAEQLTKVTPRNKVRFIWFGAEESGLLGSEAYVAGLSAQERSQIAAMLNFDMVGSPNFVRFVYDGDLSDSSPPPSGAPPGSDAIETLFLEYFASQGLATEPTAFDGRSDYGPFIEAGIPAGGLFTGAEGIKSAEQAATYGGEAGEQYDPCYHLACDDIDNLSVAALDQMSDAAAHATISLAQSTQAINGQRGKGNFNVKDAAPPTPIAITSRS